MNLKSIASLINEKAANYEMANFQELRKDLHILSRVKMRKIFNFNDVRENWAFHSGGRKEIQFNIGFGWPAHNDFKFGIAASLRPSRSLQDPLLILKPKILRLIDYFSENRNLFKDLNFYDWFSAKSSDKPIICKIDYFSNNLIQKDNFLFWGKHVNRNNINIDSVLSLFDRLLEAYEYAERGHKKAGKSTDGKAFEFKSGCPAKSFSSFSHLKSVNREILLRHNRIQEKLYQILAKIHGKNKVGAESSRVDLAVKKGKGYIFYEIKTGCGIKSCIRDSISQLLEYSYWPGSKRTVLKLVILSENLITSDAKAYLQFLRNKFKIPVYYQSIDLENDALSSLD